MGPANAQACPSRRIVRKTLKPRRDCIADGARNVEVGKNKGGRDARAQQQPPPPTLMFDGALGADRKVGGRVEQLANVGWGAVMSEADEALVERPMPKSRCSTNRRAPEGGAGVGGARRHAPRVARRAKVGRGRALEAVGGAPWLLAGSAKTATQLEAPARRNPHRLSLEALARVQTSPPMRRPPPPPTEAAGGEEHQCRLTQTAQDVSADEAATRSRGEAGGDDTN